MPRSTLSPIAAIVAASLLVGACGKTDTDPNTVSPTATIEIITAVSGSLRTVQNDGRTPAPSAAPVRVHRADGVTIKGSGSQLDRNMGSVELAIIVQSLDCERRDNEGKLVTSVPAEGSPAMDLVRASDGQPIALQIATYELERFLTQVPKCPDDFNDRLVGRFLLRAIATNIKGRATQVETTLDLY